ncbi:unnamed protein product [Lactuca saligna]|uniref:SWIM-type domain-containing protein n=1 Tax=Lactuca saligna TaxID=75948 RepID=A0AA35YBT6_LACSI|nr:unnamed protein product [Lactuca saligna]
MVYVMWQIIPKNEVVDVSSLYAGAPTWFSIKLHHGGKFTKLPDIKYTGGEVRYVDYVDIDEFSVHELDAIMLDLGYPDPRMIELSVESPVIYYHFRIPNGDFQFGLRALGNDQDVINLSKFIQNNKLIEVYTEHGKTNLLTYFMSPNAKGKVVIEELPENDDQRAKYEAEVHVESPLRNMNHVNDEPIGEYMSLILFGSKTDAFSPEYRRGRVGNSKREEGSCSKRLNLEDIDDLKEKENTNEDEMIDGCYNTPPINDDEQYNELFDNLMENLNGSDEYVEEYEGDVESEESDEEYEKDEGDDHDGKQSENEDKVDDIMDEENNIEDVDVDMADFFVNVESDVEGACINDGHEPEDMEVINNEEYQVTAALQDQHVVDVRNQTCTCRKWELMGIPCRHAIATLNEMSKDPEAELDIYKWVHKVYWLETWQKAYSFKVEPIKGRPMWPKSNCPTKLIPPPHHTQVGRPKKKRRQSEGERLSKRQKASAGDGVNEMQGENSQGPRNDGVQKLSRKHVSVTCSKCKNKGHNSRTCKGQGGNQSKK